MHQEIFVTQAISCIWKYLVIDVFQYTMRVAFDLHYYTWLSVYKLTFFTIYYNVWLIFRKTESVKHHYGSWMGMADFKTEGDWRWAYDSSNVSCSQWYPGQPDDMGGEDCGHFWSSHQYQWNDAPCHLDRMCYIWECSHLSLLSYNTVLGSIFPYCLFHGHYYFVY